MRHSRKLLQTDMASPHSTPLPPSSDTSLMNKTTASNEDDRSRDHEHDQQSEPVSNDSLKRSYNAWIGQMVYTSSLDQVTVKEVKLEKRDEISQDRSSKSSPIMSPPPVFTSRDSQQEQRADAMKEGKRESKVQNDDGLIAPVPAPIITSSPTTSSSDSGIETGHAAVLLQAHAPDTRATSPSASDANLVFAHNWSLAKQVAHLVVFGVLFLVVAILHASKGEYVSGNDSASITIKQSLLSQAFELGAATGALVAMTLPSHSRHCVAPVLVMGMAALCTITGFSKSLTVVAVLRAVLGFVSLVNVVLYLGTTLDMAGASPRRVTLFLVVLFAFVLSAQAAAPWIVRLIEHGKSEPWRYWSVAAACVCHVALAGCICDESNDDGIRQRHADKGSTRRSIGGESVTLENIWRHICDPVAIITGSRIAQLLAILHLSLVGTTTVLLAMLPSEMAEIHHTGNDYITIATSIAKTTTIVTLAACAALQVSTFTRSLQIPELKRVLHYTRRLRRILLVCFTGSVLSSIVLAVLANAPDMNASLAALALAVFVHFAVLVVLLSMQTLALIYCLAGSTRPSETLLPPASSGAWIAQTAHTSPTDSSSSSASGSAQYHVSAGTKVTWATTTMALLLSASLFAGIMSTIVTPLVRRHFDFAVTAVALTCIHVLVGGLFCIGLLFCYGDTLTQRAQTRMLLGGAST